MTITWNDLPEQDRYEREMLAIGLHLSGSEEPLHMVPQQMVDAIWTSGWVANLARFVELDKLVTSDTLMDMRLALRADMAKGGQA